MNAADVAGGPPAEGTALVVAAPLVRRMAAFLYEGVLLFGVVFATGLVYAVATRQTNAMVHRTGLVAACFVVLGLYFVGMWVRAGQTLAMKTWHLRVVDVHGLGLTPWHALARYLACWVWFLPPLAAAAWFGRHSAVVDIGVPVAWIVLYALSSRLHPRRQFWHDALCGTAIVSVRPARPLPQ